MKQRFANIVEFFTLRNFLASLTQEEQKAFSQLVWERQKPFLVIAGVLCLLGIIFVILHQYGLMP